MTEVRRTRRDAIVCKSQEQNPALPVYLPPRLNLLFPRFLILGLDEP